MATLGDIATHLDQVLEVRAVRDYGPNGLQVEARGLDTAVTRVATAVSANLAAVEAAVAFRAELLVVHHGLIWGGGIERVTGPTARARRTPARPRPWRRGWPGPARRAARRWRVGPPP